MPRIQLKVTDEILGKLERLAERRYGSRKAIDKVIQDALWWKVDYWERHGVSFKNRLYLF